MAKEFWEAVRSRRSVYSIGSERLVSEKKVEEIVIQALTHVPSAFNSQSTRIVLLFGTQHQKLWAMTCDRLRQIVPPEQFAQTEQKINRSFAAGYGTVLFFEDRSVVDGLAQTFAAYADRFPVWSQHTSAMHQFVIWTALEAEGLGASLQHYNPLIDADVAQNWEIPDSWTMVAQMPFGKPLAPAGEKAVSDIGARLKVFK